MIIKYENRNSISFPNVAVEKQQQKYNKDEGEPKWKMQRRVRWPIRAVISQKFWNQFRYSILSDLQKSLILRVFLKLAKNTRSCSSEEWSHSASFSLFKHELFTFCVAS